MGLEWWYWIIGGVIITLVELVTLSSFFLIWFGSAAVVVGFLTLLFKINLTVQLVLWAGLSTLLTVAWFRFFKPSRRAPRALNRDEFIGAVGVVSKEVGAERQGEMMFQRPMMGADRWPITATQTLAVGAKVRVVEITGQTLQVTPWE